MIENEDIYQKFCEYRKRVVLDMLEKGYGLYEIVETVSLNSAQRKCLFRQYDPFRRSLTVDSETK